MKQHLRTILFFLVSLNLLSYVFGQNGSKDTVKNSSFTLFITSNNKLEHAHLVNSNDEVAVLEYQNYMGLFYDNNVKDVFVFDYTIDQRVYIPHDASDNTLEKLRKNYEEHVTNYSIPLKELYSSGIKEGYQFDILDEPSRISNRLAQILRDFSTENLTPCQSLGISFQLAETVCDSFNSSLKGFGEVTGESQTKISGDLQNLANVFIGISFYFENFEGGIGALHEKNTTLELNKMFNSKTGCDVLIYLLEETSPKFDIGKLLGDRLNSRLGTFEIASYLGGRKNYGFEGVLNVMYEISKYNNELSSRRNLAAILNKFFDNPRENTKGIAEEWADLNNRFLEALQKLNLTDQLKGLVEFGEEIHNGKWIDNGVNMTAVFYIVVGKSKNKDKTKKIFEEIDKDKKGEKENSKE